MVPERIGSRTKARGRVLIELKPGEAFRRVRRPAIGTVNYLDRRAGVRAEEPPVVADGTAPVARLGHAEYATAALAALRDGVGHTLVLVGKQDGKHPPRDGRVGRVRRAEFERLVVVVYLPVQRDAVELE